MQVVHIELMFDWVKARSPMLVWGMLFLAHPMFDFTDSPNRLGWPSLRAIFEAAN